MSNAPRLAPGAGRRALGAGWFCVGPRCAGQSPRSVLGPAGEGADHRAGSSSGQIYCKPNYPGECHLWTWTCASDHPVKNTRLSIIQAIFLFHILYSSHFHAKIMLNENTRTLCVQMF